MRKMLIAAISILAILSIALLFNYGLKLAVGVSVFLLARHFLDRETEAGAQRTPWWSVNKRIRLLALAVVVFFVVLIGYGAIIGYE